MRGLVFILSLIALSGSIHAEDWRQFRGPDGMATSLTAKLPVTWSATENIVWKIPLPGPGSSSPIVVGGRLFPTYYTGYGQAAPAATGQDGLKLHVLCLNRTDARTLWDRAVAPELPEQEHIRDHREGPRVRSRRRQGTVGI